MSLQDLPVELLRSVGRYLSLNNTRLSPFSTVNAQFKDVIEAHTFARLKITSDDLAQLAVLLQSSPMRRAALQTLQLTIILPTYSLKARGFMENAADQALNNLNYSQAIFNLFDILRQCDCETSKPLSVQILTPRANMDRGHRGREQEENDQDDTLRGRLRDLGVLRYRHSHLKLLNLECLPNIQRVQQFHIRGNGPRYIEQAIGAMLMTKFPKLESAHWLVSDNEKRYGEIRLRMRQALTEALTHPDINKGELKSFIAQLEHQAPENHAFISIDVRGSVYDKLDDLSICLGNYLRSNNLVKVVLSGPICVAPELLWHQGLTEKQSCWPNLETLRITLSPVRPDGDWYLERDPYADFDDHSDDDDEGEEEAAYDSQQDIPTDIGFEGDEYHRATVEQLTGDRPRWRFRAWPAPELVNFYKATACAAAHMPKLRQLTTVLNVAESSRTEDTMSCLRTEVATSGNAHGLDETTADIGLGRIWWQVPKHWQMDEELSKSWQLALGVDMVVRYDHW